MARLMIALCRLEQDACKKVTLAIKDNLFELDFDSKGNCFIDIEHEDVIRVSVQGEGLLGQNETGELDKSILVGVSVDSLPAEPDQVNEIVDDTDLTLGQNETGELDKSILVGVSVDSLPAEPDQVTEIDAGLTSGQKTMQDVPIEIVESLIKEAEGIKHD